MTDTQDSPTERNGKHPAEDNRGLLDWMKKKQYWLWVGPMAIVFAATVMLLKSVGAPTVAAVAAGIALDEASEPYLNWLLEWERAEREVREA